jgi:hypothetical protein
MPKCSPADLSKFTLPDLESIARESGLVTRNSSKFCVSEFLQSLLCAVVTGKASLNEIAAQMHQRIGKSLSKQGLSKRFGDASTSFLTSVLCELIARPVAGAASKLDSTIFKNLLIQDSSFCPMSGANAANFPAHGNGVVATAGVKIDLVYDLGTSGIHSLSLHPATEQDKTIGKDLIDDIGPGDLIVRDMGYSVISEFVRIEGVGAYWLSRLPVHTKVVTAEQCSLEQRLKRCKENVLDLEVRMGNAGHKCRLVAIRAEKSVCRQRRKERQKKSGKKSVAGSTGWIRDGWHLLVTNIDKSKASAEALTAVYRVRWDIEIVFRGWKQSMKLKEALDRKSSEAHLMALTLAAMIHQVLGMKFRGCFQSVMETGALSIEKLCAILGQHHLKAKSFEAILLFKPDRRHIQKDRRKRSIPVREGLAALT